MEYTSDNFASCRYKCSQEKMAQVFQRGACSFHLSVVRYDRPKWCHCFVQAHTMSSVDVFSTPRSSKIHPLRRQRRFQHQLTMNWPAVVPQSRDSPHKVLFFNVAVTVSLEMPRFRRISSLWTYLSRKKISPVAKKTVL